MNEEKIFVRLRRDYKKHVELELEALRGATLYEYIGVEQYAKMKTLRKNVAQCGDKLAEFAKVALEKQADNIVREQLRKNPPF